jgi:hypothetical protein
LAFLLLTDSCHNLVVYGWFVRTHTLIWIVTVSGGDGNPVSDRVLCLAQAPPRKRHAAAQTGDSEFS